MLSYTQFSSPPLHWMSDRNITIRFFGTNFLLTRSPLRQVSHCSNHHEKCLKWPSSPCLIVLVKSHSSFSWWILGCDLPKIFRIVTWRLSLHSKHNNSDGEKKRKYFVKDCASLKKSKDFVKLKILPREKVDIFPIESIGKFQKYLQTEEIIENVSNSACFGL